MAHLQGVYRAQKKDGSIYYRSSITFKNKHISLGSFNNAATAHQAYQLASTILFDLQYNLLDFKIRTPLSLDKWVILMNYRDNGLYIKNPIYLHKTYFSYYLDDQIELKFDVDDLFYYSNHKIFRKHGKSNTLGYLFTNDYGMQVNILNRYGIKNHGVLNKDYRFIDNDPTNLTRQNIDILNAYHGVELITKDHTHYYMARINIVGRHSIGKFKSAIEAAIAYNKAADFIMTNNISSKEYALNYIDSLSQEAQSMLYDQIQLPKKLLDLC